MTPPEVVSEAGYFFFSLSPTITFAGRELIPATSSLDHHCHPPKTKRHVSFWKYLKDIMKRSYKLSSATKSGSGAHKWSDTSYKLEINACFVAVKLFVKRYSLIVEHTHRQRHHRRVQRRSKWLKCLLKKAVASIIKAMRKSRIKKHRPSECDGCHDTVFVSSRVTYNTLYSSKLINDVWDKMNIFIKKHPIRGLPGRWCWWLRNLNRSS